MKKLLVVDGNSVVNRAFYGIRPLTNKEGLHTNAIYGMINIIMKQVDALNPDYCAIAFDLKAPTFRHEMFDAYKAGRHETPPELLEQFPYAKSCAEVLGFKVLELKGYEADDILGTLAEVAETESCEAYILTGDRDSLQLITDKTKVLLLTNSDTVTFDKDAFFEKYGVKTSQFVDVKALMGDSSDNIPGVAGIGEKTALKLISEFESLENLYSQLPSDKLSPSVNKKLTEGRENAFMSQKLAKIFCQVPIINDISEVEYNGINRPAAKGLFQKLGLATFIKRFGLENVAAEEASDSAEEVFPDSVDTETKKTSEADVATADKDGIISAFANSDTVALVKNESALCFGDDSSTLKYEGDIAQLSDLLCDSKKKFICYDCKSLYKELKKEGIDNFTCHHDIMLGAYVLDPSGSFDFERINTMYGDGNIGTDITPSLILSIYRNIDAKIRENKQENLLYNIEMPLAKVLADMESCGFMVNINGLREFGERLSELENEFAERIYYYAGGEFNINSPKQLGEILFDRLMLPHSKKTKNGYSTNAEVLEKLRPYHPIIEDILDYRQVAKLKGTYADGLIKVADGDGRIHTNFKQTGTATGRLSSNEPNLQNIPIRTELGREFRRFFVPKSDRYVLIDADYSQIELRILADISGDEHMIEAFKGGEDIHTATASKVFGVGIDSVTPELRKRAKAVNFGIVYGIGDFSLAADIGTSRAEARNYIDSYLATYPMIDKYLKDTIRLAYENGFVTTAFGRRRYIEELSGRNKRLQSFGERVAMNSPIQGTAADIIKIAMVNVYNKFNECGIDARLILQVHDELIVEASCECADEALEILRSEMENAVKLSVPLDVDVGVGVTWYDCK